RPAPDFSAQAVIDGGKIVDGFTLSQFKELHAFQAKLADFKSKNVELVAVSTDTEMSHWGWLQVPKDKGGIQGITYPIVADTNKTISYNYDVLLGQWEYAEN
ncbi:unnamed protein product, partial [Notodromas monacha]